jgi:L-cystine transport system ATP-binding protein
MIRVENVHKAFGEKQVLRGVTLSIAAGEIVAMTGASGSGKTTFLRCLNLLERSDRGELSIDGLSVPMHRASLKRTLAVRRKTAMVFQQYNLFKNMDVLRNVEVGQRVAHGKSAKDAREAAIAALEKVGMADYLKAYPSELSGGQQQRVGIARAIALEPKIILFDEPTSALDPELVGEVLAVIRALAEDGQTMLIVSHEMNFVRKTAHRIVFMHEGVIHEEGAPEEFFLRPKQERTARFLKSVTDEWNYQI